MEQNLSQYRIFYAVAKAGNISRAAKELYISQPAISKSISRLEESLGVTLFSRSSRGVTLTEEGKILYQHIQAAFEAIDAGEEKVRRMNAMDMGTIHIGVSNTLCKFILIPYLKAFIEKYPHIKIIITCQSSNQTLEMLDSGKIDIGLIAHPGAIRNMDFHSLGTIQDIFVASPSYLRHLELDTKNIHSGRDLFEKGTLMLLDKHNMTRQYIDDYMTSNHLPMNNTIEATTMELLIEFARIGLGVGCVIKEFVTEELSDGRLKEIPLDIPIHRREIGFTYIKKRQQEKAVRHFIDFYKSTKETM